MDSRGYIELKVYQLAYKLAMDCKYINEAIRNKLYKEYEEAGRMLGSMADNPDKFLPR